MYGGVGCKTSPVGGFLCPLIVVPRSMGILRLDSALRQDGSPYTLGLGGGDPAARHDLGAYNI